MAPLTVDELRAIVRSSLDDTSLQMLLDAAETAIIREVGEPGARTEVVDGGLTFVTTRLRIGSITSVKETTDQDETTLAADDYRIRLDDRTLQRLGTGTNPSARWGTTVAIAYTPEDDDADRRRAQSALVRLDLNYSPGLTAEQIGAWMQQQSTNPTYLAERAGILASLWSTGEVDFA